MTAKDTRKLDREFSLFIREVNYCEIRGLDTIRCNGDLQCMHIVGRANRRLRWDKMNAICGCAGHHIYYTYHPFEFYELIKKYFPEKYQYVNEHRNEIVKLNKEKIDSLRGVW